MATFVYAPEIRVNILSQNKGEIDVSGDIVNFDLIRRSNTVSNFNFTLQNTQRKYDQVFRPGDTITVFMKRIKWVQVFTGSLNNGPVFSAWPRALPMTASCTLKKLQFWPWDPTAQAAVALVQTWTTNNTGNVGNGSVGDGGLSKLVTEALAEVTNWPRTRIHIGQVPNQWFQFAQATETLIDQESNMANILGSSATIAGQKFSGTLAVTPGNYGGVQLDATQLGNAAQIYSVILGRSDITVGPPLTHAATQDRAAEICFMTVMAESTMTNLTGGDRDSVGIFQQRPSQGWGTVTECEDVTYATTQFLNHLVKVQNWWSIAPQIAAQDVQRSGFSDGSNYAQYENMGIALAAAFRSTFNKQMAAATASGIGGTNLSTGIPNGQGGAKSTGTALSATAKNLIESRPAGSIIYVANGGSNNGDDVQTTTTPTKLDCSSLVQWCYYHTTGSQLAQRTAADQAAYCSHTISVDLAKDIQGALLFVIEDNGIIGHVGISLGDGVHHVAAHMAYPDPTKDVDISPIDGNGFNTAGLLPTLDYSSSAGTQAAAAQLRTILNSPTAVTTNPTSITTDPTNTTVASGANPSVFEEIVSVLSTSLTSIGDAFGGARGLIHNQPILPWIKNVTNSSMRSFCSAPNGDFIAWFPDYFNVWGTAAAMNIQTIELQDFTVDWSDQQIVTHEFVLGSIGSLLDNTSGTIMGGAGSDNSYQGLGAMFSTNGIVTMDFPGVFKAIYNKVPDKAFTTQYLQRFGARPNLDQMSNIQHGQQEFLMALWNFMQYWAGQFTATVPMTFMPELYPGMIIRIPELDFQAYVTDVEHQGSYGDGGQFTTNASIIAPARISSRDDLFGMLPISGNATK